MAQASCLQLRTTVWDSAFPPPFQTWSWWLGLISSSLRQRLMAKWWTGVCPQTPPSLLHLLPTSLERVAVMMRREGRTTGHPWRMLPVCSNLIWQQGTVPAHLCQPEMVSEPRRLQYASAQISWCCFIHFPCPAERQERAAIEYVPFIDDDPNVVRYLLACCTT